MCHPTYFSLHNKTHIANLVCVTVQKAVISSHPAQNYFPLLHFILDQPEGQFRQLTLIVWIGHCVFWSNRTSFCGCSATDCLILPIGDVESSLNGWPFLVTLSFRSKLRATSCLNFFNGFFNCSCSRLVSRHA